MSQKLRREGEKGYEKKSVGALGVAGAFAREDAGRSGEMWEEVSAIFSRSK